MEIQDSAVEDTTHLIGGGEDLDEDYEDSDKEDSLEDEGLSIYEADEEEQDDEEAFLVMDDYDVLLSPGKKIWNTYKTKF